MITLALSTSQRAILGRKSLAYHDQLWSASKDANAGATVYFKSHAIGDFISRKYRLGLVLAPESDDEMFAGRLSIPYLTKSGVVGMKYRDLSGAGPKYLYPPGTATRIFNPSACYEADEVIGIAEGEIDAIVASELLGLPTVGIPGATQWASKSAIWRPIFKDFRRIVVLADGDDAGRDLGAAIKESLTWRASIVRMPDGEDVASMCASGRAEWIKERIA